MSLPRCDRCGVTCKNQVGITAHIKMVHEGKNAIINPGRWRSYSLPPSRPKQELLEYQQLKARQG